MVTLRINGWMFCVSLWSFVGGWGFVLMVGSLCCSWVVMPVLCGGWLWFVGHWGGHPTLLVGRLWLFVGGHTHFMSWWAVVMGGCAPCHLWILTGGGCGRLWVVIPVQCHGGWLVQSFMDFETMCDSTTLTSKTQEPVSWVRVRLGLQIPNLHPPPPMTPTHTGSETCDIPYGQAVETHWKITALARQKILHSDYPKSDGVWPESTQKSSGIVKTSIFGLYDTRQHRWWPSWVTVSQYKVLWQFRNLVVEASNFFFWDWDLD